MKPGKDFIGVGVGVMIFNDAGELLLLKRGKNVRNEHGCWELPGGRVKFGETMAAAAVREAREEANLDIEIVRQMITVDHLIPEENQHWVSTMFIGQAKPGQKPKIMESEKCDDLGWFALNDLPNPLSIATELKVSVYRRENSDDIYKAAGLLIKDRKVLAERSTGKAFFVQPGGKIEAGETAKQALVRELKEELTIDVDESDLELIGNFSAEAANNPGHQVHMQAFIVKNWRGDIKPDSEVEELLWINSNLPKGVEIGSIYVHDLIPRLKDRGLID